MTMRMPAYLRSILGAAAFSAALALLTRLALEPGKPAQPPDPDSSLEITVPPGAVVDTLILPRLSPELKAALASFSGLRYLALGDSFTAGQGVKADERYPTLLVRRLRNGGVKIEEPVLVTRTGWTSADLLQELAAHPPKGTFDLVTLLVGVNDQYRGRKPEDYRALYRDLLRRAVELVGGDASRVIALSLPDWGASPYAGTFDRALIGAQIDAYNHAIREEAAAAGTRYVDITPLSREALKDESLAGPDRLHPSARQHAAWTDLLQPEALAALGQ